MPDTATSNDRRPVIDSAGLRNVSVTLTANCRTRSGGRQASRLDVTSPPPGEIVENIDGVLTWVDGPPDPKLPMPTEPMAPPGHYQLSSDNIHVTMTADVQQASGPGAGAGKWTSKTLDLTSSDVAFVGNVGGNLVNTADQPPIATVDGIEVTQAVQDLANSTTLIRGKKTYVRVYVTLPGRWVTAGPSVAVSGSLTVETLKGVKQSFNTVARTTVRALNQGSKATRRLDIDASLNFELPSKVDDFKNITLQRCVLYANGKNIQCTVQGDVTATATFTKDPVTLRLRIVALRYPSATDTYTAPAAIDYDLIRSWLERAYPVSEVRFSRLVTDSGHEFKLPLTERVDQAILQVTALRHLDIGFNGIDARTRYYGLVLDQRAWITRGKDTTNDTFMRGKAATIPSVADPGVVAAGPTGTPIGETDLKGPDGKAIQWGYFWDKDASFGDWYTAHEIGHTLGLFHVKATGDEGGPDLSYRPDGGTIGDKDELSFVGFDKGDSALGLPAKALPPTNHDVMSYGDDQWVSRRTFEKILARLQQEEQLNADGSGKNCAKTFSSGAAVSVVLYRQTGKGLGFTFEYVNPVPGGMTGTAQAGDAGPQIQLIVEKKDTPKPPTQPARNIPPTESTTTPTISRRAITKLPAVDDDQTFMDVIVPTDLAQNERITSIEFWNGGAKQTTWTPTENATRVSITSIATKTVGGATLRTVTWSSVGGQPHFNVQVGRSKTENWQTVAVGLDTTTFDIDIPATWTATWVTPTKDQLWVRIMATNGVNAVFSPAVMLGDDPSTT